MPELPEVETVRRGISPHIEGAIIEGLEVRNPNLRWQVPAKLAEKVIGHPVLKVTRRGKYIIWQLPEGCLIWHLGMSGVMRVLTKTTPIGKHDHVDVLFADKVLRFTDPRRFGCLLYVENEREHPLLKHLGPEPLSDEFNADYLAKKLKKTQRCIKVAIMDSHIVVGVGNIYASEALFIAQVSPQKLASKLTSEELERLVVAVKDTLDKAIQAGGTTLKDFMQSDGKPGYFRHELQVYGRDQKPCFICQMPIQKIVLGQRSTYFCPKCQKD